MSLYLGTESLQFLLCLVELLVNLSQLAMTCSHLFADVTHSMKQVGNPLHSPSRASFTKALWHHSPEITLHPQAAKAVCFFFQVSSLPIRRGFFDKYVP